MLGPGGAGYEGGAPGGLGEGAVEGEGGAGRRRQQGVARQQRQPAGAGGVRAARGEVEQAVRAATASLLPDLTADQLNAVPDSSARLAAAGVAESEVPWLYRMWDGKPASFHIRWEAIGHGVTHTGEMVSMRNRMGLSPF